MAERSLEKELDTLRADLGAIKDDIANISRAVSRRAGKAAANGRAQAEDLVADLTAKGEESLEVARGQIAERPLTSLLVAFGVGMVLSKLLDRR